MVVQIFTNCQNTKPCTGSKTTTASYVKAWRIISRAHEMKFLRAAACCEHTLRFGEIRFENGRGAEHVGCRRSRTNGGERQKGLAGEGSVITVAAAATRDAACGELAEMRIEGNIGTQAKGERRCRERIGFPVSARRETISSSSAERCWTPPWLFKRSDQFLSRPGSFCFYLRLSESFFRFPSLFLSLFFISFFSISFSHSA